MKKAMMFAMLTVLGAMFLLPASAQAQSAWHVCTVEQVGPALSADDVFVHLAAVNGSFTGWYTPLLGSENKMLAIGLTAMANNMKVRVFLNPGSYLAEIRAMYLLPHDAP